MNLSIDAPWDRLNEAIRSRERSTLQGYTLILVPHSPLEPLRMTLDGKPIPEYVGPNEALEAAVAMRGDLQSAETARARRATEWQRKLAAEGRCMADSDGDCDWAECPQLRDGEPKTTGRECPRWAATR